MRSLAARLRPDSAQEFASKIAPALTGLGVDPANYAKRAAPLQYRLARAQDAAADIAVGANMLEPVGGVSHVRIVYPMQAMRTDPTVTDPARDGGDMQGARQRRAAHLRAAPADAVRRSGRQRDPQPAEMAG